MANKAIDELAAANATEAEAIITAQEQRIAVLRILLSDLRADLKARRVDGLPDWDWVTDEIRNAIDSILTVKK